MTAAAVNTESDRTIHNLAREALNECGGDTKLATQKLVAWLNSDKALMKNVVSHAIYEAARTAINQKMANARQRLASAAERVLSGKDSVMALAGGIAASLLDFPLAGGVKLATATREQVIEAADRYESTAIDAKHKSQWLRLIAQSVPEGKTVGDVLSDARALELWKEAESA